MISSCLQLDGAERGVSRGTPTRSGRTAGGVRRNLVDDVYDIADTVKLSAVRLKDGEKRHPDIVVAYNDDPEAVLQGVKATTYTGMWLRRGDHGTPGQANVRNTLPTRVLARRPRHDRLAESPPDLERAVRPVGILDSDLVPPAPPSFRVPYRSMAK